MFLWQQQHKSQNHKITKKMKKVKFKKHQNNGIKKLKEWWEYKAAAFSLFSSLTSILFTLENCLTDLFYIYGQDCFKMVQLNFQMNITLRRIWFLPSVGEKEWLKRQVCELQIYWEFVCTEQCWTFKLLFCINNNNTLFNLFISSIQKWYPIQGAPPQWSPKSK